MCKTMQMSTCMWQSLPKLSFYPTHTIYTISSVLPVQNHLLIYRKWVHPASLGAKSIEKTNRNTGHSCSCQQTERKIMKKNRGNTGEMMRRGEKPNKKRKGKNKKQWRGVRRTKGEFSSWHQNLKDKIVIFHYFHFLLCLDGNTSKNTMIQALKVAKMSCDQKN